MFPVNRVRNEKLKYDVNREAAKISSLSSGNIDKYMSIKLVKRYYLLIKTEYTYTLACRKSIVKTNKNS